MTLLALASSQIWILAASVLLLVVNGLRRSKSRAPLPPGPKPLPVLGNLDVPTTSPWLTYDKWSKIWGDVISVKVLNRHIIVLNSLTAVNDLLEKRSNIYSDRPRLVFAGELMGWDIAWGLIRYNDRFKVYRKLTHQQMSHRAVMQYRDVQEATVHGFLLRLTQSPETYREDLSSMGTAIIFRILYGHTVKSFDDHYVTLLQKAIKTFVYAITPGSFLVDMLPFLKAVPTWVPGSSFKVTAKKWAKFREDLYDEPFQMVKDRMAAGNARPSFTSLLLESKENHVADLDHQDIVKWISGSLYSGGAETIESALLTFFLTMTLHPEAQKKAQAEIDRVVGTDRLPTWSDRQNLPYVAALCLEVLRWHPPGPMGIAHAIYQEDTYRDWRIPAGSIVMGNIWSIAHDEAEYKDPWSFKPERFIAEEGRVPEKDPLSYIFGFGRRVCPGNALSEGTLFMAMSCVLASFWIQKAKDANGIDIEPVIEYTGDAISLPKPFQCSIQPRSQHRVDLIRQAAERTQNDL